MATQNSINSPTPMTVAKGGTGLATLTDKAVLIGAGTGNVTFVAPSTSGNVLTSDGTNWASTAPAGSGTKIATDLTQYTAPANTSENTAYTVSLPSNVFGSTNAIRATIYGSTIQTSGGTNITWRAKLGSTTVGTLVFSSTATGAKGRIIIDIVASSSSAQKTNITQITTGGNPYVSYDSSSVDTSGALNLVITIQKADSGTIVLEGITVEKIV